MEDEEIIRQAMSVLGKRKTARKTAAQKINIAHAATFRTVKPCTCSSDPHRSSCPVYAREAQRKHREKKV